MRRATPKPAVSGSDGDEAMEWELRPGGMLVQKREEGAGSGGAMIRVKVLHGSSQHEVSVPSQSTFGELKGVLARKTGLEPQEQKLSFRGKEKDDGESLHMAGVKDVGKVVLSEVPGSKERKLEKMRKEHGAMKASEAVARIRAEVNKLAEKVSALETSVRSGMKVAPKEFDVLSELLMLQMLKLDGVEAEGEAKVQRRNEVRRIQSFVDILDLQKARNSNPVNASKSVSVSTQWKTFGSGFGSLSAPPPRASSTTTNNDWENYDD